MQIQDNILSNTRGNTQMEFPIPYKYKLKYLANVNKKCKYKLIYSANTKENTQMEFIIQV